MIQMPGVCRGGLGEAAQAGKGCGLVSFPPAEAEGPWQTF